MSQNVPQNCPFPLGPTGVYIPINISIGLAILELTAHSYDQHTDTHTYIMPQHLQQQTASMPCTRCGLITSALSNLTYSHITTRLGSFNQICQVVPMYNHLLMYGSLGHMSQLYQKVCGSLQLFLQSSLTCLTQTHRNCDTCCHRILVDVA